MGKERTNKGAKLLLRSAKTGQKNKENANLPWIASPKSRQSFKSSQKGGREGTDVDRRSLFSGSYEIDEICRK
jgi:hypothetical protein